MPNEIHVPSRREAIRAQVQSGGGLAAVFPYHPPRALLRAHGLLPVEVWGPPGRSSSRGDAHLQPYTCSLVRAGLSFLLEGGLDQARVVLVPHGCDSLQGLGSVLLDFVKPAPPVLTCYLPRGDRALDRAFLADELRELDARLAAALGTRPDEAALLAAVEREERADQALGELLEGRARVGLGEEAFYRLVRSREYLPAEDFAALAGRALAAPAASARPARTPLVVSGLVPEPMALLSVLEAAGATVTGDDLACSGRRRYRPTQGPEPFARMSEGMLSGPPDSTRGASVEARLQHLRQLARAAGARGVVFLTLKFCEPELYYLPQLREGLAQDGVRALSLEVDLAEALPAPLVTRLEAFVETLR
ncbi:MAG TPA: 2-hydroxyacyl-CoA dehydratase family protein [Myxococcota bacterium]|nr:2-hydroxyacyl-CoA dehydratase family protein [Myxococcota bacterium]HRY93511.1 2-hydroxyacyl-CoA dehydratase family protein [Myxococcota bacterium]HSA21290.1 2-hydroxyacyl-CoA dehydratase family protein [Myxococcota bacterium]